MWYSRKFIGLAAAVLLVAGGSVSASEHERDGKDRYRIGYGPGQLEQTATAPPAKRARNRRVSLSELTEEYEWRRRSIDRLTRVFRYGSGEPVR